jgi:hypothetical protein
VPIVYVKLPFGMILQVERQHGGYKHPTGGSAGDKAFAALALGTLSSGRSWQSPRRGPTNSCCGVRNCRQAIANLGIAANLGGLFLSCQ